MNVLNKSSSWFNRDAMTGHYQIRKPSANGFRCECGRGCESVLECRFWFNVRKTPARESDSERQAKIGSYRIDGLFFIDGKKVAVELDGQEFHDAKKDSYRDQWLMNFGGIDHVVRIPFAPMWYFTDATMCVLATWYPRFSIHTNIYCMSVGEFSQELKNGVTDNGDYLTEESFLEMAEPNYEIWHAEESDEFTFGFAGSPRQWINRRTWKTHFIKRYVAHERDRECVPW